MDINKKIKEKGLKKNWIADQLGISKTLLSFYLTDTRPMPDGIRIKLEELLK